MQINPKSIKTMSNAFSDNEKSSIVFTFQCHDGSEHHFTCPADAVPTIVSRLVAAHTGLAIRSGIKPLAIQVQKSEIGIDEDESEKSVTLGLFPTENLRIGFALDPKHAQKVSSDLAHAAAILLPRAPRDQN